jgi:hypothetical protein
MNTVRRRPRDGAGDADGRDGFPCWIGCDAHGVRCWSWESVRLVEWIPVPTLEDAMHNRTAIAFADGSERSQAVVVPVESVNEWVRLLHASLDVAAGLARRAATVPPC